MFLVTSVVLLELCGTTFTLKIKCLQGQRFSLELMKVEADMIEKYVCILYC